MEIKNSALSEHWRRCSSCKKPIPFRKKYWICNVSTCNRKRTALAFCEVSCWDAHLPLMNHRESWAEERTAPSSEEWQRIQEEALKPVKRKPKLPPSSISEEIAPLEKPAPVRVILRRTKPDHSSS